MLINSAFNHGTLFTQDIFVQFIAQTGNFTMIAFLLLCQKQSNQKVSVLLNTEFQKTQEFYTNASYDSLVHDST